MDAASRTFVDRIALGATPFFTTFSGDGKTAYVCHQAPDGLAVIDASSRRLIGDHAFPSSDCIAPHQFMISADGSRGQLLCEGDHKSSGTYVLIDLATFTATRTTPVGIYPVEMDLLPKLGT